MVDTHATREYAVVRIQALHRGISACGVPREGVGTSALFRTGSQECDATFGSSRTLELMTESDDVKAGIEFSAQGATSWGSIFLARIKSFFGKDPPLGVEVPQVE